MGVIAKPYNFVAGGVIVAGEVNADFDTIYAEFNGNIDDTNIKAGANIQGSKLADTSIPTIKLADNSISNAKIDYTSALVLRTGVPGLKMARGSKAFTLAAGVATVTITFSTDSADGDPQFGAAPVVVCSPLLTSGTAQITTQIHNKTNLSFQVDVKGSGTDAGTVEWHAMG